MKISILGDSTTQEYGQGSYPQQGWAHYLKSAFTVEVRNYACAGYSLKSFLYSPDYQSGKSLYNEPEKSRWVQILKDQEPGDYLVIYWGGINDMMQISRDEYRPDEAGAYVRDLHDTQKESYIYIGEGLGDYSFFTLTSQVDEYCKLLSGMIRQAQDMGVKVVLSRGTGYYYRVHGWDHRVVSVCRRYTEAVADVAAVTGAAYLDVGSEFETGFRTLGYEKMLENYFLSQKARERFGASQSADPDDSVHYNLDGAKYICEIFLNQLKASGNELAEYLKK